MSDLTVTTVAIDSLVLDPNNARKHGRRNLDAIRDSLAQFGQRRPLVVRSDGVVIAGNGTLEAARSLGWADITVTTVPDEWTADQARAYAIADNRTAELATWDDVVLADTLADLNANGWDVNGLGFDGLPAIEIGDADDRLPTDLPAEPIAKPGDVWQLGEHRVVCGGSDQAHIVAALFEDRLADLVMTDPPYGVAYESRGRKQAHAAIANDAAKDPELYELIHDSLGLAWAYASDGAPCYVFHSDSKRVLFEQAFIEAGFFLHQTLQWVKDRLVLARTDYQPQNEPCLYGWKPGKGHTWHGGRKRTTILEGDQVDLTALSREELLEIVTELRAESTVLRHDRPSRSDEHPTMKPVGLIAQLIVNSSRKGQLVYDPFLGSGTTLIAAERQGRICYGVELEPAYVDVIVRRWEQATGGKAQLANG